VTGAGIGALCRRLFDGYGPSDDNGNRLVRTVYIQIPRGARKTTIGAGFGLLHSFGHEKVPGGSCILAAGAEDQAQLAFDEANGFIQATKALRDAAKVTESELLIEHPKSGSELRAIPAEGDVQHGKTPYFVLIDELHVWKNRRLWKALKTGLLKVPNKRFDFQRTQLSVGNYEEVAASARRIE
jgi:phage terminase large subunit-like protein